MLRLQTPVDCGRSPVGISFRNRVTVIGSCFADNVGGKMTDLGFDVCVNPFGTLYNPRSISESLKRLKNAGPFSMNDCVMMGSGAGLWCSFSHHTSFARKDAGEFLQNANSKLAEASAFFHASDRVIITLGTSWCYRHIERGVTVSNCLKRDAKEFVRERMEPEETAALLREIVGESEGKKFILTVSPIRHFKDGAHGNQTSKAALLLAADRVSTEFPDKCAYFPAFEIMMDELRDYRFYAEDMIHPSAQAVEYIWERFCDFALPQDERGLLETRERELKRSRHRMMH